MDGTLVQRADKVAFMEVRVTESAKATVTGTGITGATVVAATFGTKVLASGTSEFEYDGSDWKLSSSVVILSEYGITPTGSPYSGDKISVKYVKAGTEYHRMQGFTDMSKSLNPKEYSRQYVDEKFEQTDVTGFSPSIAYGFDQYKGNAVHDELVKLSDNEAVGTAAVRAIIIVDFTKEQGEGTYSATKRDFAVIPDSEGGSMDAYTYSGNFKVKGDKVEGTATTTDDWLTITFVPA